MTSLRFLKKKSKVNFLAKEVTGYQSIQKVGSQTISEVNYSLCVAILKAIGI